MIFEEYLSIDSIKLDIFAAGKRDLFQKLASMVASRTSASAVQIIDALMQREQLGSTSCGHGIAIPHAIVPELKKPVIAFIRLIKPLFYCSWDFEPVDLVCLLLVPPMTNAEAIHLLSQTEHRLRHLYIAQQLREATSIPQTYSILLSSSLPSLSSAA